MKSSFESLAPGPYLSSPHSFSLEAPGPLPCSNQPRHRSCRASSLVPSASLSPPPSRILLAEDDADSAEALLMVLGRAGYDAQWVDTAHDAASAPA